VLGGAAAGAFWLGGRVWPAPLAAVAAITVLAALSGGLHLDGLADSADGLLGGSTPEQRLEIMRDPQAGAFGVVALVLVLAGDLAALSGVSPARGAVALLGAGALSRLALLLVVVGLPYVRESGLGTAAQSEGRLALELGFGSLCGLAPLLLDWRRGLLAVAAVVLAAGAVALFSRARVGGATGDVYGAVVEVSQLAALAAFAVRW